MCQRITKLERQKIMTKEIQLLQEIADSNYDPKIKRKNRKKFYGSRRRFERLVFKFKQEGPSGLVRKNTSRIPHNKISNANEKLIVKLYKDAKKLHHGAGYNLVHFQEKLRSNHQIEISYKTIKSILGKEFIVSPKANKTTKRRIEKLEKLHKANEPKQLEQELITEQMIPIKEAHSSIPRVKNIGEIIEGDASIHEWTIGSGIKWALHKIIDSATKSILGAWFEKEETSVG